MTDLTAQTVHDGSSLRPWRRDLIREWLTANGIAPNLVPANQPIHILTVPQVSTDPDHPEPRYLPVVVFTQLYARPDGKREFNFLTGAPVSFQRTVPLQEPFPPARAQEEEGAT